MRASWSAQASGGIRLGAVSGLGLLLLVVALGVPPDDPPATVLAPTATALVLGSPFVK